MEQLWPISKSGFDSPIIDVRIPESVITSVVEYSATLAYVSTDKGQIFEVNVKTQQVSPILSIANEVASLSSFPVVDSEHGPILQQSLLLHRLRPSVPSNAADQTRKIPAISVTQATSVFALPQPQPLHLSFSSSALLHGVLCYTADHVIMLNLKTYQFPLFPSLPQSPRRALPRGTRPLRRCPERLDGDSRGKTTLSVEPLRHAATDRQRPRGRPLCGALRPPRGRGDSSRT